MIRGATTELIPLSTEELNAAWSRLNERYFQGRLPAIPILWSGRLTASVGMFASRVGPRTPAERGEPLNGSRRVIRLSIPLLRDQPEAEIIGTLAHEMIHQWQYDVLKRRPDHGPDFMRVMALMNQDGLGITIRHNLDDAVRALSKYTWRCQDCGRDYHRQRRTIRPRHHRCGACSGRLREIVMAPTTVEPRFHLQAARSAESRVPSLTSEVHRPIQLSLPL